jgi:hypothetical protein
MLVNHAARGASFNPIIERVRLNTFIATAAAFSRENPAIPSEPSEPGPMVAPLIRSWPASM